MDDDTFQFIVPKGSHFITKLQIYHHLLNYNNGYNIPLACNTTSIFHFVFKNLQKIPNELLTLNIFFEMSEVLCVSKYNHTYQIFVIIFQFS